MYFETFDDLHDPKLRRMSYVMPKLDGNNITVVKDEFGSVKVFTRQKKDITDDVKHCEFYQIVMIYFKGPVSISGELWRKNLPCSSISTAIKNREQLQFMPFWVQNISTFEYSKLYCEERNLPFIPFKKGPFNALQLTEYWQDMKQLYYPADGLVFSDGPNTNLCKWKPTKTIDLILVGWRRGKVGQYHGTVGTLICQTAEGIEVAKCQGMSQPERAYIKENFPSLVGRVIEVEYNGVAEKGRLRHPRFVRFREDKAAADCTLSQDKELELKWENLLKTS